MARMSVSNYLWKADITYSLSEDDRGENVRVELHVKTQCHARPEPEKSWRKRQRPMACVKSTTLTYCTRTTVARMSACNGLWLFDSTYSLNQDNRSKFFRISVKSVLVKINFTYGLSQNNRGENVSVELRMKNQFRVQPKPGQPRRECQRPMSCQKSNSHTL